VLASAGLLERRTMTSWPGIRDDVVNAGATWLDQEVVHDGNLVTSRGPQDLVPFVQAISQLFSERAPMQTTEPKREASSPQRDEPPALVLGALKWMPRPSLRAAFGIGAVAAGLVGASKLRSAA
jgi:deglycase